jgi:hypothetical protein
VARAAERLDSVDAGWRAGGRAGAGADGVHASPVGGGERRGAAVTSHARLDAHRHGRAHRRHRTRAVDGRVVDLSRRRAG